MPSRKRPDLDDSLDEDEDDAGHDQEGEEEEDQDGYDDEDESEEEMMEQSLLTRGWCSRGRHSAGEASSARTDPETVGGTENEQLKAERSALLQKLLSLTHLVEAAVRGQEKEVVDENLQLSAELGSHREMFNSLMSLLPDMSAELPQGADGDQKPALTSLLCEIADEAELKVLNLLSASQSMQGGNWKRAKYNASLALPDFFSDLKLHYQLGHDNLQMRFDIFFPGFTEKVVTEIVWRLFSSREHARRIIRSDALELETIEDVVLDPKTGARAKVVRFENKLTNVEGGFQETIMGCGKRRSTLARSTLAPPKVPRKGAKRAKTDGAASAAASATTTSGKPAKLVVEDWGDQDCSVVSVSSTMLYPMPARDKCLPISGQFVQGAIMWTEKDGVRLAMALSYPNEYRFNGTTRLDENHIAFTPSGNVSMWLTRLVEHAASQFVSFMLEETLHRQGRNAQLAPDSQGGNAEASVVRVSELSSAAAKFLQRLARPASASAPFPPP
jgi:hypothetical protein